MSNERFEVLMWAQRLLALEHAPAHQLLDLPADASVEQAQAAFHKIARTAHPDLHRRSMTPDEFGKVELAYARAAGAYQELRKQRSATTRMRPIKDDPLANIPGIQRPGQPSKPPPTATPAKGTPTARGGATSPPETGATADAPAAPAADGGMNSKAKLYFRKAEMALRRGDFRGALLQMKMAIAADPQSPKLRQALTEIEAELGK